MRFNNDAYMVNLNVLCHIHFVRLGVILCLGMQSPQAATTRIASRAYPI